jgi:5'-nucleotidase
VLSGVNRGVNLGEDVTYSGTVAAAMEATLLAIPAVALSQARNGLNPVKWDTAETHAPDVIRRLMAVAWTDGVLMTVNFPDVAADRVAGVWLGRQGRRISNIDVVEARDPGGRPYLWIGDFSDDSSRHADTDLAAIGDGAIAVTPLHLDLTHRPMLRKLKAALS